MPDLFIPVAIASPIQTLEKLLITDPGQRRRVLQPHPVLMKVAHERADDMAMRRYFSHVNPDGLAANWLVRDAGYALPDHYHKERAANNIESISAGQAQPAAAWRAWLSSPSHRLHVLGENDFFAEQYEYGIGFANIEGSPFQFYWVLIIAQPKYRSGE